MLLSLQEVVRTANAEKFEIASGDLETGNGVKYIDLLNHNLTSNGFPG